MPREVDPGTGAPIGLAELVDLLESERLDPRDIEGFVAFGPALARLGRNPDFLARLAVAELQDRCRGQASVSGYDAQSFVLTPPGRTYTVRANFWPAAADPVVRASGGAAFAYGMPHDHNFSFLTVGYLGPGYWSDYWEYDGDAVAGLPGEDARLRFVGRQRLSPGRVLFYRAHRDVHDQLPPDAFSVSLNILGRDPAQGWRSQYRFDTAAGTIAAPLTTVPAEGLLALAVHLADGCDVAASVAARHPVPRVRATALAALASARPDEAERLYARAADDPDRLVAGTARDWLRSGPGSASPAAATR